MNDSRKSAESHVETSSYKHPPTHRVHARRVPRERAEEDVGPANRYVCQAVGVVNLQAGAGILKTRGRERG